jgi:hypothetical protein
MYNVSLINCHYKSPHNEYILIKIYYKKLIKKEAKHTHTHTHTQHLVILWACVVDRTGEV